MVRRVPEVSLARVAMLAAAVSILSWAALNSWGVRGDTVFVPEKRSWQEKTKKKKENEKKRQAYMHVNKYFSVHTSKLWYISLAFHPSIL